MTEPKAFRNNAGGVLVVVAGWFVAFHQRFEEARERRGKWELLVPEPSDEKLQRILRQYSEELGWLESLDLATLAAAELFPKGKPSDPAARADNEQSEHGPDWGTW